MNTNHKEILKKLGFDIKESGTQYFIDIIEEVSLELITGVKEEEIKEKIPSFCIELYHFYYEVGRKIFFKDLTDFYQTKHQRKKLGFDKELHCEVYGDIKNPTLEQSIIAISTYLVNKEILPPEPKTNQPAKILIK